MDDSVAKLLGTLKMPYIAVLSVYISLLTLHAFWKIWTLPFPPLPHLYFVQIAKIIDHFHFIIDFFYMILCQ